MRKSSTFKAVFSFAILFACVAQAEAEPKPGDRHFRRIIMVVLENTNYSEAVKQPFLKSLMQKGATLTNLRAITHPSQPNYVAMVAGSTIGVRGNEKVNLNTRHIGDLLEEAKLDWRVYAEDFPGNCFLGMEHKNYARRHVPFISFLNVQSSPQRCAKIRPVEDFDKDAEANQLPEYSFYVPNVRNDGHDTGVTFADSWLSQKFGALLKDSRKMDGTLFVVTFDEGEPPLDEGNKVLTIFVGPMVQEGATNNKLLNFYSLLRLMEDNFGLGTLDRKDADATLVDGIWRH
jgi:hypothetical protein